MSSDLVPLFPVEIFEHIIDQSSDRDGSLCCLSLICRAFLPRARLNLFFHIHIGHKEKLESVPAFLHARPWLPPLVRCLTIRHYVKCHTFKLLAVVPALVIAMLPNLRSFEFATDLRGRGSVPDDSLFVLAYRPSRLSALRKSCVPIRHLQLTRLHFRTVVDFVQLVRAFPNLKHLTCERLYFEVKHGPGQLRDAGSGVIQRTVRLTHLITDSTLNTETLNILLDMGQTTLEDLEIPTMQHDWHVNGHDGTGGNRMKPLVMTTFSRLRRLHTLTLTFRMTGLRLIFKPLEFATEILSNTRTSEALHRLNVVWSPEILVSLAFDIVDASQHRLLKAFEEAIARLRLREVVFCAARSRKNRREISTSALDRAFPALKERGILKVTDRPLPLNQWTWFSDTAMGHDACLSSLIVSPNGRFFATSSEDTTIILWDAHRGTIVHEWVGHSGRHIGSLAFSPDSRYLLSSGNDRAVKVWDVLDEVRRVHILDAVASGGIRDGPDADALDADTEEDEDTDEDEDKSDEDTPDPDAHNGCAWSPDSMWIASKSGGRTVQLWDARNFHRRRSFKELATSFRGAPCFSPNSRWLVWPSKTASSHNFCVWDALVPDAPPRRFPAHRDDGSARAVSFDPTSTRLLTVHDCLLRIWDIVTGTELAVMQGHTTPIRDASFSPDGRYVLSAAEDGVTVWYTESGKGALSLGAHVDKVVRARFSPEGDYIATGTRDRTVQIWRTRDGSSLETFTDHNDSVMHIVFSPDGKTLVSGDGVVRIRDISHIIGQ